MHPNNIHRIRNQTVEVEFRTEEEGFGLQDRLAGVFYDTLLPGMEGVFDEMCGENQYAYFDRIELDCGILPAKNWEQELTGRVIRMLRQKLSGVAGKKLRPGQPDPDHVKDAFLFYLEKGYLPWDSRISTLSGIEKGISMDDTLIGRLREIVIHCPAASERLAVHFSGEFVSPVVTGFVRLTDLRRIPSESLPGRVLESLRKAVSITEYQHIAQSLASETGFSLTSPDHRRFFDTVLLLACASEEIKTSTPGLIRFLNIGLKANPELSPGLKRWTDDPSCREPVANLETSVSPEEPESTARPASERTVPNGNREEIYIENAGLLLLHPFLPVYFGNLKFTLNNEWIDDSSRFKAIAASQFLVTGSLEDDESRLVLNKILCGLQPGDVLTPEKIHHDELAREADILLNEVIRQWSILKNTSIDGLREAFLQRQGKLTQVDKGWLLQVERKPFDTLLNHLPWGIGLIRLPWMEIILYTEWNT